MRFIVLVAALNFPSALAAQAIPHSQSANPRIQAVTAANGELIYLTALPGTAMTVALERSEIIDEVVVGDRDAMAARVTSERNGFQLLPQRTGDLGYVAVTTSLRHYRFSVSTSTDYRAAYLVEVQANASQVTPASQFQADPQLGQGTWDYRIRGDREVRPARIFDDGSRTQIEFAPDAALPAIFAIGPSGEEQVVNGYMRGEVFVIDRVWEKLIFRIDKAKATASRNHMPENRDG